AEAGAIAERRMDRLLDATRSHGLAPFLADEVGVDSGLMIGHYTAAAMASENKRLAAPASVDSLPTSGMQEDHVSMAWSATRKLRQVIDNVRRILAVEYTIAARAVEARSPLEPAAATGALIDLLRSSVPGAGPDRYLAPELASAEALLISDQLIDALHGIDVHLA
ncbi:MAG: aromatic amino acid lyase, partial [Acidimicrobiia bacterium]